MYSLYFKDKIISFTSQPTSMDGAECSFVAPKGGEISITKVVEKVENCKQLYIHSEEPSLDFERFCSQFERVDAAGGIVQNKEGDILMILRHGRWDLPKGHVEDGELASDAALREVWEETGIGSDTVGLGAGRSGGEVGEMGGGMIMMLCWVS